MNHWANEEDTREIINSDGWLHTDDKARIQDGQVYITGRLKEIIVLANGEKVPPADMEMAICMDALFEQALVIGDNRPYLTALVVLEPTQWELLAKELGMDPGDTAACNSPRANEAVLERVANQISSFPGYARIHKVHCQLEPWSIEDGLITPTLKLKRNRVCERFEAAIDAMYDSR